MTRFYLLICIIASLAACGSDDNSEPPAELTKFNATAELFQNWSIKTSKGIKQQFFFIEPLLLNDKIVIAGREGAVSIVDIDDGLTLGELQLDTALSGGVGGNEKLWLFTTRDGEVIAIDAKTTEIVWTVDVPGEVLSRPVIHQNTVLVRTDDGQLVSLDMQDGEVRWAYKQAKPALTLRGSSAPVLSRDKVFIGLPNGRLLAISPDNGEVVWDIALSVPKGHSEIQRLVDIDGQAELFGHILYVAGYQGKVAAVDVQRGQFLWTKDFSTYSGVTIDAQAVYSSDDQSHVWALDRFNGATMWKQDKLQARKITRPVLVDDYIVVGDYDGYLHVMSRSDGRFVARVSVGNEGEDFIHDNGILVPPVISGDNIIVTTRDGLLHSYVINEITPEKISLN